VEPLAHRRELSRGIGADVTLEPRKRLRRSSKELGSAVWTVQLTVHPEIAQPVKRFNLHVMPVASHSLAFIRRPWY
jgi:hypothetical protein